MRAQRQNTKPATLPAPMGGMNSTGSLLAMSQNESCYTLNLIPGDYGLEVRKGYAAYGDPVPVGDSTTEVRTVMGYRGTADDRSKDRLFAVSNLGIYEVGTSVTQRIDFSVETGNAGYGVYTNVDTIGGSYLFYADEENGGFRYEEDTDTWLPIPDLTLGGVAFDPSTIVHVVSWKNRVWFTIRNSSTAYYLPLGQVSGELVPFNFGNKFPRGGSLIGLWSWTIEGGTTINDYLVAISRAGDLLIYQGLDPSNAASFGGKGSWFLGELPAGRSGVFNYSGDLLVLTVHGVMQLSALLKGTPASDDSAFLSRKINRFIQEEMYHTSSRMGWQIAQHPRTSYLMVVAPPRAGTSPTQFVKAEDGAWTQYRGIPISSIGEFGGDLYIGTDFDRGHRLFKLTGDLDNGKPIQWSCLTSYSGFDAPANSKRVHFIRPIFVGSQTPVYDVQARYDFDLNYITGVPRLPDIGVGIWDTSQWDKAIWGEGLVSDQKPYGGAGMGRHVAVAIRGASLVSTTLVGFDVMMDLGGML